MAFLDVLEGTAPLTPLQKLATQLAYNDYDLIHTLISRREELGLTQTEMALRMGVSQQAVSKFEQMESDPRLSTIRRYALAVGLVVEHSATPSKKKVKF